jgi:hypothetical protein
MTTSIFYHWTYVAPATILAGPTEDQLPQRERELTLREEASCGGICFVRVLRQVTWDLYQANVAASPELLHEQPFPIFLTKEQLRYALPWDVRLQDKQTPDNVPDVERILTLLHAHAAAVQPALQKASQPPSPDNSISVEVPQKAVQTHVALAAKQDTQAAPTRIQEDGFRLQQAFLSAMIDALMERLYQGIERSRALVLKAQCSMVIQAQHLHQKTPQCLVNAVPYFSQEKQRTLWHLSMHIPEDFSLTA